MNNNKMVIEIRRSKENKKTTTTIQNNNMKIKWSEEDEQSNKNIFLSFSNFHLNLRRELKKKAEKFEFLWFGYVKSFNGHFIFFLC